MADGLDCECVQCAGVQHSCSPTLPPSHSHLQPRGKGRGGDCQAEVNHKEIEGSIATAGIDMMEVVVVVVDWLSKVGTLRERS